MSAALNLFLGQHREPALDQVEPRRAGRRKVHMKPRTASEPASNARGLVRAVVVENQMGVEIGGYRRFDRLEEALKLLTPVAAVIFADDPTFPAFNVFDSTSGG